MNADISRRKFVLCSAAMGSGVLSACNSIPITGDPWDEFVAYDALGLAELVKSGQLSQAELTEIIIARIETSNPVLNFMTTRAYDRARAAAGSIPLDSPFAGVPILMKDMIDVGGIRRTDGSRLLADNVPQSNVAYVDAIESAGLNILGMTNVPELASFIMTDNALFGATRNPWNLEYSTFTSSGGSAAAVSAGVLPMAHGTDGAGSCRLPASTTGLLGMKPSRQRMLSGEADGGHDITKTNQVMSRTVRDSAALLNSTEDKSGRYLPPIGYVSGPSQTRLSVACVTDKASLTGVEPAVLAAHTNTATLLEALGHRVLEVQFPIDFDELFDHYLAFSAGKMAGLKAVVEAASGKPLMESGLLTPLLATNIERSLQFSASSIELARIYFNGFPRIFERLFRDYDLLLTPVSPVLGVQLNEASFEDSWSDAIANFIVTRLKFTAPINFGGNPAMSAPLNWAPNNGMPIGSHFVAAHGNDRLLYELAYELESARPWRDRWAPWSLMHAENFA